MPDVNALNFLTLQNAVLGKRFPEAQRTNCKRWLATAYNDVWNALRADGSEWAFEIVSLSSLTVTGGDSTPTMPVDYGDTLNLWDANGSELERLGRAEFEQLAAVPGSSGLPIAYTVIGREINLYPVPTTTTLKHSYRRRVSSRTSALAVQAGMMNVDGDFPLWDDHHSVLIPRAISIGLKELNDPTWPDPQQEYQEQLGRMKEDYEVVRPQTQWPSWSW